MSKSIRLNSHIKHFVLFVAVLFCLNSTMCHATEALLEACWKQIDNTPKYLAQSGDSPLLLYSLGRLMLPAIISNDDGERMMKICNSMPGGVYTVGELIEMCVQHNSLQCLSQLKNHNDDTFYTDYFVEATARILANKGKYGESSNVVMTISDHESRLNALAILAHQARFAADHENAIRFNSLLNSEWKRLHTDEREEIFSGLQYYMKAAIARELFLNVSASSHAEFAKEFERQGLTLTGDDKADVYHEFVPSLICALHLQPGNRIHPRIHQLRNLEEISDQDWTVVSILLENNCLFEAIGYINAYEIQDFEFPRELIQLLIQINQWGAVLRNAKQTFQDDSPYMHLSEAICMLDHPISEAWAVKYILLLSGIDCELGEKSSKYRNESIHAHLLSLARLHYEVGNTRKSKEYYEQALHILLNKQFTGTGPQFPKSGLDAATYLQVVVGINIGQNRSAEIIAKDYVDELDSPPMMMRWAKLFVRDIPRDHQQELFRKTSNDSTQLFKALLAYESARELANVQSDDSESYIPLNRSCIRDYFFACGFLVGK